MNSDTSIENDVGSEISDYEVNHSLRNLHSSPILPSQKIEKLVRSQEGNTDRLTSQSNPIDSEDENQSKSKSKSSTILLNRK